MQNDQHSMISHVEFDEKFNNFNDKLIINCKMYTLTLLTLWLLAVNLPELTVNSRQ